MQKGANGQWRPIFFASRKCTPSEALADATEGELIALVFGIRRFEKYLASEEFDAFTDNMSLAWLKDKRVTSIHARRWQKAFAFLAQFRFMLHYKPGKDMADVDALSRIDPDVTAEPNTTVQDTAASEPQPATSAAVHAAGMSAPEQSVPAPSNVGPQLTSETCFVDLTYPEAVIVAAAPKKNKGKASRGKGRGKLVLQADKFGAPRVELEQVWGFDSSLPDLDEQIASDEEIAAVRAIRDGKSLQSLTLTPRARENIAGYLGRDKRCEKFREGEDGRLYHIGSGPNKEEVTQLVVPVNFRGRLVTAKHEGCNGHRSDTLDRLKRKYFWPSMTSDVKAWIDACACQRKKREHPNQRVGNIQSLEIVAPGEWITFDFFGPLPESINGNKYLLVMVDRGSREIMLEALPDRKAVGVAEKLYRRVFLRGVSPRILQSDLAKEFVSEVLKSLSSKLGAKLKHSSPYHPQTNTSVERYNKTIATSLSLLIERADQKDWDQHLGEVEYSQLCAAQPGLGKLSPLFLSRGIDPIEPIDRAAEPKSKDPQMRQVESWLVSMQKGREIAYASQKLANAAEALRMAKIVKSNDIKLEDEVWVYFPGVPQGLSKKLAFRLHGP
jgi:transposase InsO family protein